MMPLAIGLGEGSELWQPMGIVIIGGLSSSMILTLLVLPAMYASNLSWITRFFRWIFRMNK
jgi:HAE1 family hydrophobic/amphiphilic exporter-1